MKLNMHKLDTALWLFLCSSFVALGPYAISYLWVLAMLELRQHETLRQTDVMDPLDDSERAQFRADCYGSSFARVAAAMAKAAVMRFAGTNLHCYPQLLLCRVTILRTTCPGSRTLGIFVHYLQFLLRFHHLPFLLPHILVHLPPS